MAKKSFGIDKTPILDQRPTTAIFSEETIAAAVKKSSDEAVQASNEIEEHEIPVKNESGLPAESEKGKVGFKIKTKKPVETKSKQIHLILKPSTYNALKITAKSNACSMNDLVSELIETYCIVDDE